MMSDREAMESAELVIACYEEDGERKWTVLKDRRGESGQQRPQAEVIERAREARHTYLQAKPGSPERRQAGRELAAVSSDLLAYVEAAPQDTRTPLPPDVLAELEEALGALVPCGWVSDEVAALMKAVEATLPYLRADEVMTREEWMAEFVRQNPFFERMCGERLRQKTLGYDADDAGRNTYSWAKLLHDRVQLFEDDAVTDDDRQRRLVQVAAVAYAAWEALTAAAPCPHEDAEWDAKAYGGAGGWQYYSRRGIARTQPGKPCIDCGEKLPPAPRKPVEEMSAMECDAELEAGGATLVSQEWGNTCLRGALRVEGTLVDVLIARSWRELRRAAVRALREWEADGDGE